MNDEQTLKMTDLDYLTAAPHLQMIKAALPYIHVPEQRFFSLLVKVSELQRTLRLFDEGEEGMVGIASLEKEETVSPLDMLNAMKPYGTEAEQEFIDLVINFLQGSRLYQSYREATDSQEGGGPMPDLSGQSTAKRYANAANSDRSAPEESRPKNEARRFPLEQLKGLLPPESQARLETAQMLMQTFQQFS